MLRLFRGLAAAALFLLPLAASAGVGNLCEMVPPSPSSTEAGNNQIVTVSFQIARTSGNTSVPCLDQNGTVNVETSSGSVVSVTSPGAGSDTDAPYNFIADEGETVTITYNTGPSQGDGDLFVFCESTECSGSPVHTFTYSINVIDRQLQITSGDTFTGDPNRSILLSVRATNDGSAPFTPIPIQWSISGPGTLDTATSNSDFYNDAFNGVNIQEATPGNNVITVVASRTDAPGVTATFTITVNIYEMSAASPPPGTRVQVGTSETLTVSLDRNGMPAEGLNVVWNLVQAPPGTELALFNSSTNGGQATNTVMVGPAAGSPPVDIIVTASINSGSAARAKGLPPPPIATTTFTLRPFDVFVVAPSTGDSQTADVGQPLPNPLVARVTRNGAADVGGLVNWSVAPAGAAELSALQSTVDSSGNATVNVTQVNAAGPFTVTAAPNDDPTITGVFNGNGTTPTLTLVAVSGDNQSAPPDAPIPQPLIVRALLNGSPQSNVTINWTVSPSGAASPSSGSSVTDTGGQAQFSLTNGPAGGAYTVTAARADDPTVQHVFNLAVQQRDLSKPSDSGNGQFAAVNTAVANPLVVVATLDGATEPNIDITWSIVSGSATLSNPNATTDSAGRASVGVTMGPTPGPVVIRATRDDDTSIVEDYTLTSVSKMLIKPGDSGDNQTGGVGATLQNPLVAVATLNGSPEPNVAVNWSVQSGSATLSNITSPTDGSGRSTATVTLGNTAGPVVVRAARNDIPSQFQDYTLTIADVRTLDKPPSGSGDNQSGQVGTELPQTLVVFARDNGQPVAGVQVTWVASNGATVNSPTTTTDATGRAEVVVRLGPTPGTVNVTATRSDATTANASFVLTATASPTPTPQLTLDKPSDSGDGTTLQPGQSTTLTVVARSNGIEDANVPVFWQVLSGSAVIGAEQSISGTDGRASTTVVAGATPGPVTVRAVHGQSGATQVFTLTVAGAGVGNRVEIVSGDRQQVVPGARGESLVVRLLQDDVPVPNAVVAWSVLQGDATLDSASSTTGSDGTASNGITFGSGAGEVLVQASANGASTTFHMRAVDTGANSLRLVSGNNQRGPSGTRADLPILVEVVDGNGEPVLGQPVAFIVQTGSATLDSLEATTDALGRASMGFRFGNTAGPVRIRASIGQASSQIVLVDAVAFNATLTIVSGDNQSAAAGTLLPQDLVVQIGSPPQNKTLAGAIVRWEVLEGGGTLASPTTTTDASGRASNKYTLGPSSGTNRIRASVEGGATVTFTATATTSVGDVRLVSGDNQTLPTRTPSAPIVFEVRSPTGVPLQGVVLRWTGTNAEPASATTTTDAQGRASNVAEVVLPGAATLVVTVEGISNISFVVRLNGGVSNVPTLGAPEETVANAIDNLCPALVALSNPTPAQADLRARCLELVDNAGDNPDQVDTALDEMRQDVALAQASAAFVSAQAQFDNLKTRIAALRSGNPGGVDLSGLAIANSSGTMPLSFLPSSVVQAEGEAEGGSMEGQELDTGFSRWGFFASGIIGRGSYDGSSITPEYDYDTNGITAGVDYRINDEWVAGVSAGWNQQETELTGDAGAVDADGWSISGYTTWFNANNWYVDGMLSFGSNDYEMQRRIRYDIVAANGSTTSIDQLARADSGSDQFSMAFSFGRDFQRGALSFGPYVRGLYTSVDFDAYAEQLEAGPGAGLGLAMEDRELTSMTSVVGGKLTWTLSRDWGILMPHAQLEWEHEFEDDPQQLVARFLHDPTNTQIRVEGDEVDTDYFNIGLGLSALFANGRSAFLYYEHLAGSEGLSQDNLSLGVRIEF